MSDTLLEFATPLLEGLPAGALRSDYHDALQMAVIAWNLCVRAQAGAEADFDGRLTKAVSELNALSPDERAGFLEVVRALALRKLALFPDDRRIVMDVEAAQHGPDIRVLTSTLRSGGG